MTPEERFTQNERLIWGMLVRKYGSQERMYNAAKRQRCEVQDFYQTGAIALWRACLNYDESKGVQFSSFACTAILRYLGQQRIYYGGIIKLPQKMPYDEINLIDSGIVDGDKEISDRNGVTEHTIFDLIDNGYNLEYEVSNSLTIKDIVTYVTESFSEKKARVFLSYYLDETKKTKEIAKENGISVQRMHDILKSVRTQTQRRFSYVKEDMAV